MSFLKKSKDKAKLNPRTEESKFGGKWLMNDLNWGPQEYPVRQVAGMTGQEQDIQNSIYNQAMNGGEGYNIAMDHIKNTLNGDYDPRDSDFYKGYRAEMEDLRGESNARLGRVAQLGGMANSTSAYGMRAENDRRIDNSISQTLGSLWETERNRMDNAANTAGNLDQMSYAQKLQADQALIKERVIEQMQKDAIYQAAYQELMHQYNVLAPIATNMMNYSPGVYMQPGGPSDWDVGMGVATDVMGVVGGVSNIQANNAEADYWDAQANNPNAGRWAGMNPYFKPYA